MTSTRRVFLTGMAAARAAVAESSRTPSASVPRFLIPAVTPVDRKDNFDEPLWRDMVAFFRAKGADGVVAAKAGADSVLIMPPFYFKTSTH